MAARFQRSYPAEPLSYPPSYFSYCPSGARSSSTRIVVADRILLTKPPTLPKNVHTNKNAVQGRTSHRLVQTAIMNSIVKKGLGWRIYAEKALEALLQPLPQQNRRFKKIQLPPSRLSHMSISQDSLVF